MHINLDKYSLQRQCAFLTLKTKQLCSDRALQACLCPSLRSYTSTDPTILTGYRISAMLQVRRQLPELLARLESSLTASTAQAWETVQKRDKITVRVVNNQVRLKPPGVLNFTGIVTRG